MSIKEQARKNLEREAAKIAPKGIAGVLLDMALGRPEGASKRFRNLGTRTLEILAEKPKTAYPVVFRGSVASAKSQARKELKNRKKKGVTP